MYPFKPEEVWMKPGSIGKFWQQQGWAAHSSFADGGRHPPRTREARLKTMHWKPCFMHCLCHLDKEGWPKDDLPKCTWGLGSSEQVIPKPEATYTSVYELPTWEAVCRIAEQPIRMKKSFVCIHFFPPPQRPNQSLYWHKSDTVIQHKYGPADSLPQRLK